MKKLLAGLLAVSIITCRFPEIFFLIPSSIALGLLRERIMLIRETHKRK